MRSGLRGIAGLVFVVVTGAAPLRAHFHILLPQAPAADRGAAVEVVYRWGHPFEHQIFDADVPQDWFVLTPDGTKTDLLPASVKLGDRGGTVAFRASFSPKQRGDYTCVV